MFLWGFLWAECGNLQVPGFGAEDASLELVMASASPCRLLAVGDSAVRAVPMYLLWQNWKFISVVPLDLDPSKNLELCSLGNVRVTCDAVASEDSDVSGGRPPTL